MDFGVAMGWLAYVVGGVVLVGVCGPLLLRAYVGRFNGNIRVVEPRLVYRSGQLVGPRLTNLIASRGLRAVLNLQGHLPGEARLEAERRVCQEQGLVHVDLELNAKSLPPPEAVEALLEELDLLPRPLLIHCAAGSDRTGLACTLYAHLYQGLPLVRAQARHLTWRYGHLAWRGAQAMDLFFDLYRQTGLGRPLREWVTDRYPQVYEEHKAREQRETVCSAED